VASKGPETENSAPASDLQTYLSNRSSRGVARGSSRQQKSQRREGVRATGARVVGARRLPPGPLLCDALAVAEQAPDPLYSVGGVRTLVARSLACPSRNLCHAAAAPLICGLYARHREITA